MSGHYQQISNINDDDDSDIGIYTPTSINSSTTTPNSAIRTIYDASQISSNSSSNNRIVRSTIVNSNSRQSIGSLPFPRNTNTNPSDDDMGFGFTSNPMTTGSNSNSNSNISGRNEGNSNSTSTNRKSGVSLLTVFIGYVILIVIVALGFTYMRKVINDTNDRVTVLTQQLIDLQVCTHFIKQLLLVIYYYQYYYYYHY